MPTAARKPAHRLKSTQRTAPVQSAQQRRAAVCPRARRRNAAQGKGRSRYQGTAGGQRRRRENRMPQPVAVGRTWRPFPT
ncbi:MAG: hypothetical protein ACLU38_11795 [Dysosmobacter sp.]